MKKYNDESGVLEVEVLVELLVGLVGLRRFPAGVELFLLVGLQVQPVVLLEVADGPLVLCLGGLFSEEVGERGLEEVDGLLEAHFARLGLEDGDDEVFGGADCEERGEAWSGGGRDAGLNALEAFDLQQFVGVLPGKVFGVREGAVEGAAVVVLPADYLPEGAVGHAVVREEGDVLRAGVGLFVHESVGVDEVRGVEVQVLGESVHVVHEQPQVRLPLHHEALEEGRPLALGFAHSHPPQQPRVLLYLLAAPLAQRDGRVVARGQHQPVQQIVHAQHVGVRQLGRCSWHLGRSLANYGLFLPHVQPELVSDGEYEEASHGLGDRCDLQPLLIIERVNALCFSVDMVQDGDRPGVDFPDAVLVLCCPGEPEDAVDLGEQLDIIFLEVLVACEVAHVVEDGLLGLHLLLRGEALAGLDQQVGFVPALDHSYEALPEVARPLLQLAVAGLLLLQLDLLVGHQSFQPDSVVLAQRDVHVAGHLVPLRGLLLQLVEVLGEEDVPLLLFLVGCLDCALQLRVLPVAEGASGVADRVRTLLLEDLLPGVDVGAVGGFLVRPLAVHHLFLGPALALQELAAVPF